MPTFYGTGSGAEITLADGAAVTGVDIALAAATSISGRVYRGSGTAAPVADICVTAINDAGFAQARAQTDAVGSYLLRHLDPARTYTVSFAPCNIGPFVTEYTFWTESYGGGTPIILSPTVAQPLTGVDGHLTPILSIAGAPDPVTNATSATFHFDAASWPGATFICALDGVPLAACGATYAVTGLTAGAHVLRVQAWAGNLHTPVSTVNWTVSPTGQQSPADPAPEPPKAAAPGGQVASSNAMKTAPTLTLTLPVRPRMSALVRSGLPLALSCSRSCKASVDVYISASVARRLKLAKRRLRVGAVSGSLSSKPKKLVVRLSKESRMALAGFDSALRLTLRITTTDSSGRRRATTRSLRITP